MSGAEFLAPSGAYNFFAKRRNCRRRNSLPPRKKNYFGVPAEWDIPWGADMQVRSQNDGPVTILFDINEA